jgi:hypothetical protein
VEQPTEELIALMKTLQGRIQALEQRAESAEVARRQHQQDLQAVYESTSWRVTRPLRSATTLLRTARSRLRGAVASALGRGLRWMHTHPEAKNAAKAVLRLAPPLQRRLLRFSQSRPYGGAMQSGRAKWNIEPEPSALQFWNDTLNQKP